MDAFQFFFIIGIIFLASSSTPAAARHIGTYLVILAFIAGFMTKMGYV